MFTHKQRTKTAQAIDVKAVGELWKACLLQPSSYTAICDLPVLYYYNWWQQDYINCFVCHFQRSTCPAHLDFKWLFSIAKPSTKHNNSFVKLQSNMFQADVQNFAGFFGQAALKVL